MPKRKLDRRKEPKLEEAELDLQLRRFVEAALVQGEDGTSAPPPKTGQRRKADMERRKKLVPASKPKRK